MKTVAAAFVAAKRAFGQVLKDKTNPAFRSKYADLGACLEAIDKPCLDAGLAVYQETFEDATGVTVETVFLHESGESLRCGKLHVPASKQDPQGYGSALTYCRRYSLMAACGIAPEDDDGNAAAKHAAAEREEWLLNQCAAIDAAATPADAKKTVEAAVAITKQEHDADAERIILAASQAKAAKFKAARTTEKAA